MGKKFSYEHVKSFIEKENYTLLSTDYKNTYTKLKLWCPNDHEWNVVFKSFKNGIRCPKCYHNKKRLSYEYVKTFVEKEGYTLLSILSNNNTKISLRCPSSHEWETTWGRFQQGSRCIHCYNNRHHLTYEYVKEFIEKEGYTLLSDSYNHDKDILAIKCPKDHIFYPNWNNFYHKNSRCPICSNESKASRQEQDLALFVESLGINIIRNDRTQILNSLTGKNLELDIWMPSIMKAIEYNGIYWHSKPHQQNKDKVKKDQCKKLGIDLLIVDEYNWINNKEVEMSLIANWIQQ